ncbi:MAG: hypothetical protein GY760_24755 [Deltaproteobacteria bacterium]|nr:hypothetical protein [Deltaproteobacteria bacterium]
MFSPWLNSQIEDPQFRATFFSISSQVDSFGQIGGGPVSGFITKTGTSILD